MKNNEEVADQRSAQMVKQAIKDDQALADVAKDIHVTVNKGTVTLDGEVLNDQQINLATNTASAVAVDDKVKNNMEIIHPKPRLADSQSAGSNKERRL